MPRRCSRFLPPAFFGLVVGLNVSGCSLTQSSRRVEILNDESLPSSAKADLKELASIQDVLDDATVNPELLRMVLRADEKTQQTYLRSLGYFDAAITSELKKHNDVHVAIFHVMPGPLYMLDRAAFNWPEHFEGPRPVEPSTSNKTEPQSAAAASILAQGRSVTEFLLNRGYPDAVALPQTITVDHATRSVRPVFDIHPGSRTRFGRVDVHGLKRLEAGYVEKSVPWQPGDLFRQNKLEELEQRLAASGLFSSVSVQREKPDDLPTDSPSPDREDTYDVLLTLRERRARTVQLGIGYRTDSGGEASARWQHRNLFGGGENLTLSTKVTEEGYEADARITVPFLFRSDQEWGTSLTITREKPDAYESLAYEAETWIARHLTRRLTLRTGLALHYLDETDGSGDETYVLTSIPALLHWDRANNRLDATEGYRILVTTEPFQSLKAEGPFFWKNLITLNGFVPLRRNHGLALALRISVGAINGDNLEDIPAESRFFAGGGQSVRGYAYQALSPRQEDEITGGRSLVESSLEVRARLSETLGLVAFMDGGAAYEDKIPDFDETYRWGAGGGLRYFTPVGPLRFDAGFPLNRRKAIDDSWQFYVSIGQAF